MKASRMPATVCILVLIGCGFLWEIACGIPPFGVTGEDTDKLVTAGALVPGIFGPERGVSAEEAQYAAHFAGQYWRLFTSMFLHIGVLHLVLNSWALLQLGYAFEMMFGWKRLVFTYVTTGILASITSALMPPVSISAGASGAVFGLIGALILLIRRSPKWRHQPWTKQFARQLIGWAVLNVFIGFSIPHIDNAAHLGGFAAGLLLGLVPHRVPPPPPSTMVIDAGRDQS